MGKNNQSVKDLHEKRQDMWNASISQHENYIDKNTGLFDEKYMETRPCPVCGSTNERFLFHKEGGTYVKCNDCEMVFLNPVLKDEFLMEYYSSAHDFQSKTVSADPDFYSSIYLKGLELLKNSNINGSKILDFGCSAGFFLNLARDNGWSDTFGLELNRSEFEHAIKDGHKVYNQVIEEVNFEDNKFDVITLWDVFEHLKDGNHFLKIFKNILSDQGVVFLQVPNAMALAARLMHDKSNMYDGLEHVNMYSPETMKKIAKANGFEVLNMTSVISETHVLNNYINYEDPYAGKLGRPDNLFGKIDDKYILDNLLGYKLQVVLKPI